MKKLLTVILTISMLLLFVACELAPSDKPSGNNQQNNTTQNNTNTENNQQNNNENNNNTDTKDPINIEHIFTGFSEGLMFIKDGNNTQNTHPISCIDKTGKTVFKIDASRVISEFHNGLSFIEQEDAVLCDKTGKITTAQQLGGNAFITNRLEIFKDGYILVKKTTTSYQGSVDELAVFNAKLEKIVDFSSELPAR